jgi:membrane protease YdiL (CAAX protease family)
MDINFNWKPGDFEFVSSVFLVSIGFIVYYFFSKSEKLKILFTAKFGIERTKVLWILFERLTGVFFFGFVPAIMVLFLYQKELNQFGVNLNEFTYSLYWILGLTPVIIVLNYLNAGKKDNLDMYPQIRKKNWNTQLIVVSALSWIVYLMAYEFMFRGFLLFVSVQYLGVWPAITLNVAIYALVHVPKGIKEAVGAIPLGVLLCIISLQTGSILVALVVHIIMALTNEWFSLKVQPEMKVS